MIAPPAGARSPLATKPEAFFKGAHSLATLAAEVLGTNPFSRAALVFHLRRADRIEVLLQDSSGFALTTPRRAGNTALPSMATPCSQGCCAVAAAEAS